MTTTTEKPIQLSTELERKMKDAVQSIYGSMKDYPEFLRYNKFIDHPDFDGLFSVYEMLSQHPKFALLAKDLEVLLN